MKITLEPYPDTFSKAARDFVGAWNKLEGRGQIAHDDWLGQLDALTAVFYEDRVYIEDKFATAEAVLGEAIKSMLGYTWVRTSVVAEPSLFNEFNKRILVPRAIILMEADFLISNGFRGYLIRAFGEREHRDGISFVGDVYLYDFGRQNEFVQRWGFDVPENLRESINRNYSKDRLALLRTLAPWVFTKIEPPWSELQACLEVL
jgi:hypothetical protein